jgi:hypothetical protein
MWGVTASVRDMVVLVMALLSLEESTPGAYGLWASNAAQPISTSIGTFPLLDPNPFKNPLLAEGGDKNAMKIYAAVGIALSQWEHCEVGFGVLYSAFIKPAGGNSVLMRAFGTITAPTARRAMTLEACDEFFLLHKNAQLKAETRHLLNLYTDAAARRNEIVHSVVMGHSHFRIVDGSAQPLPVDFFLIPPLFSTRKNSRETKLDELFMGHPKYRYGSKEIAKFTKCFDALGSRVSRLALDIRKFYSSLPEKQRSL